MEKYTRLLEDLDVMLTDKGRGYNVSQQMNDEFWEELGTHRMRMREQVNKMQEFKDKPEFAAEVSNADSIYEATRSYLAKYK